MGILESLRDENGIPPAWHSLYGWTALCRAAALFGDGQNDEGYRHLEIALDHLEKTGAYKDGDLLRVGGEKLFGGAVYVWGNGCVQLPDGSLEPIAYEYRMNSGLKNLYYAITATSGWEWFNTVRDDARFKKYVERVREKITH